MITKVFDKYAYLVSMSYQLLAPWWWEEGSDNNIDNNINKIPGNIVCRRPPMANWVTVSLINQLWHWFSIAVRRYVQIYLVSKNETDS